MFVGKYVPNLVAKKFDVSREYAQLIYTSPRLDKVLKDGTKTTERPLSTPEVCIHNSRRASCLSIRVSRSLD
jgi:hypothetical protein